MGSLPLPSLPECPTLPCPARLYASRCPVCETFSAAFVPFVLSRRRRRRRRRLSLSPPVSLPFLRDRSPCLFPTTGGRSTTLSPPLPTPFFLRFVPSAFPLPPFPSFPSVQQRRVLSFAFSFPGAVSEESRPLVFSYSFPPDLRLLLVITTNLSRINSPSGINSSTVQAERRKKLSRGARRAWRETRLTPFSSSTTFPPVLFTLSLSLSLSHARAPGTRAATLSSAGAR